MTHMTHGRNRPPAPWPTRTQPPNHRATQDEMPRRGQGAAIATRDDERNLSSGISYFLLRVLLMTKFRRNRTPAVLNVVNALPAVFVTPSPSLARGGRARGAARARASESSDRRARGRGPVPPAPRPAREPRRSRRYPPRHAASPPQRGATRSTTDAFTPVKFTRALLASAFLWLTHNTRAGNLISDLV